MGETKTQIKKFGVLSVAKISSIEGLILGIIYGIIMAIGFLSFGGAAAASGVPMPFISMGIAIVFIMMILIGIIGGFIFGAVYAFIYNIAAGAVGGIEMDLEMKS